MQPVSAQTRLLIVLSVATSFWDVDRSYDWCDQHCAGRWTTYPILPAGQFRKLELRFEFETADDAARFAKAFNAEYR